MLIVTVKLKRNVFVTAVFRGPTHAIAKFPTRESLSHVFLVTEKQSDDQQTKN